MTGVGRRTPAGVLLLVASLAALSAPAAALATPTVISAPTVQLAAGGALSRGGKVPLIVTWAAAVGDAAIAAYRLKISTDGLTWSRVNLAEPLALSAYVKVAPGTAAVRFRLRAIDVAGMRSGWVECPPVWLHLMQEDDPSVGLLGGWSSAPSRRALGGHRQLTALAGSSATFTFTGREVGWVTEFGPTRGAADVFVDGARVTTVELYQPTNSFRRLAFRAAWPVDGSHILEVRHIERPGHPRLALDAFTVLSDPASPAPPAPPEPTPTSPPATPTPAPTATLAPPSATPNPSTATLVGAGDIASCSYTADSATAALIASIDGTVFTAGDNTQGDSTAAEFSDCFDPTWGIFKSRTRPAPGNHDYHTANAQGYFDYFGAAAGVLGQGWYAYDAGSWRIYALNSNCGAIGGCGVGSAQYAWLAADLAASPRSCTMAYWHHPIYSAGGHGNSTTMAAVFELLFQNGAELVVNGHDHMYQRLAPANSVGAADPYGIREFIVGTGGGYLSAVGSHPLLEVGNSTSHGVLRLDLSPTGYAWQFLPIAGDSFSDSGSAYCH